MLKNIVVLMLVLAAGLVGCSSDDSPSSPPEEQPFEPTPPINPQDKGDRLFGIAPSENEDGWDDTFATAQLAGIQVVEIPLFWEDIELAEGVYQDPGGFLAASAFFPANGVQVMLSLAVINTVRSTVPDHYSALAWDAPELIAAFNAMTDWVMVTLPEEVDVVGISIGNEVNYVLEGEAWAAYEAFYQATGDHFRTENPGIPVGVKCTVFGGVFGTTENQIKALNQHSDVIMLNYYQQDSAFVVFPPLDIHNNLTQLGQDFPGRDIWLTEVGFQSGSEYCGSSEAMQAIFFHELFTAWDLRRYQFKYVMIDWLHDQSPETIDTWVDYYGSADPAFVEYLSTLGLRTHDGEDKNAWLQLLAETGARGWVTPEPAFGKSD